MRRSSWLSRLDISYEDNQALGAQVAAYARNLRRLRPRPSDQWRDLNERRLSRSASSAVNGRDGRGADLTPA
jgi:hypothetical protein